MTGSVHGDLRVTVGVVIPAGELRWAFSRGTGPGGQSVNTADSRVELRWQPATSAALSQRQRRRLAQRWQGRLVDGDMVVRAAEHRSQWQNRRAARERLAALIRRGLQPPPRRRVATTPTRGAREERLRRKQRRGDIKRQRSRPGNED